MHAPGTISSDYRMAATCEGAGSAAHRGLGLDVVGMQVRRC